MNVFYEKVKKILSQNENYVSTEGEILKNVIYEDCMKMDKELIKLLLSDEETKKEYFTDVDGIFVFDKIKFSWLISNREFLSDSYTRFKNKIGLVNYKNEFISDTKDVSLVFPYKDCVLEGGQTKDDQKREEIFYNETLAPDEVDRLLYPKVFTNAKRYTKEGIEDITEFDVNDNLLIKGNNLLSLSSILKRYEGKVKCIYIDPPYNTGNDSFNYNDRFNHSTWLTFMKNRLEIAKKLLSDEGTICISIDNYELAYTLVLLDEIFGKENRKNIISIKRASASGAKVINAGVVNVVEYVIIYSKNSKLWKTNRVYESKGYDNRYNKYIVNINDTYYKWEFITVLDAFSQYVGISKSKLKKHFGDNYEIELENFVINNIDNIVRLAALDDKQISLETRELKKKSKESPDKILYQYREGYKDYYLLNGEALLFAKDRVMEIDGYKTFSQPITDIWSDVLPNDLHNEGGVELKKGKKPEKLISRIIQLCTNEGDLVLDFFAGSGTTASVATKLKRQFIICEQMDYIENITKLRMEKVISGENGGISKMVNWQGGDSFVYCELKQLNQKIVDAINLATSNEELENLYKLIKNNKFISYKVNLSEFEENINEFNMLSIENKKLFLLEVLDKNYLYVNYCDIDDEDFGISESDKEFTNSFYKG